MASRRTQIRQLFQSIPAAELSGATLELLHARCEANLAAIDVWAKQGNQQSVRKAGTGMVALCAWFAAKTLADDAHPDAFQSASGLSPKQFTLSERELLPITQRIATSCASNLSTPTKSVSRPEADAPSQSTSKSVGGSAAIDAVARWASDIKSGISPDKHAISAGPSTPFSARRLGTNAARSTAASSPTTPSRGGLRDRTTIKTKTMFDPSPAETLTKAPSRRIAHGEDTETPLRRRVSAQSTPNAVSTTSSASRLSIHRIGRSVRSGPRSYSVKLGFHLKDEGAAFDGNGARKRIKRCLELLQNSSSNDPWQKKRGSVELVEWSNQSDVMPMYRI